MNEYFFYLNIDPVFFPGYKVIKPYYAEVTYIVKDEVVQVTKISFTPGTLDVLNGNMQKLSQDAQKAAEHNYETLQETLFND